MHRFETNRRRPPANGRLLGPGAGRSELRVSATNRPPLNHPAHQRALILASPYLAPRRGSIISRAPARVPVIGAGRTEFQIAKSMRKGGPVTAVSEPAGQNPACHLQHLPAANLARAAFEVETVFAPVCPGNEHGGTPRAHRENQWSCAPTSSGAGLGFHLPLRSLEDA